MPRGPKPQPTLLKRLRGNPGQRRLNDEEPTPPDMEWELTPHELTDMPLALKEWARLMPMLRRARQITEADRAALVAVCIEWARYLEAMRKVRELGLIVKAPGRNGYPMTNPYLSVATRALAACNKLWPELGLTPSGRSRVRMAGAEGTLGDAFAEFDEPAAPRFLS